MDELKPVFLDVPLVRLIAYTQPAPGAVLPEFAQGDLAGLVAYMARVSNPGNQDNPESSKLLQYLQENKHWSPFEMVSLTFEIQTTRDIARQILRHRSFSFQEFSQRYADPTKSLGFARREARRPDPKNRQKSLNLTGEGDDASLADLWTHTQETAAHAALDVYRIMLEAGLAKEQARALLPEGLTVSSMYMTGNLRSFLHYVAVRTDPSTQKEHREVARQVADILHSLVGDMVYGGRDAE